MRRVKLTFLDSIRGIIKQPLKNLTSFFAITLGSVCVCVSVSAVTGLNKESDKIVNSLGVNVVVLAEAKEHEGNNHSLNDKLEKVLRSNMDCCLVSGMTRYLFSNQETNSAITIIGVNPDIFRIKKWNMANGRLLDEVDYSAKSRNMMASGALSEKNKWKLGDSVSIGGYDFRVVGILEKDYVYSGDLDKTGKVMAGQEYIILPNSTARMLLRNLPSANEIYIKRPAHIDQKNVISAGNAIISDPAINRSGMFWITPTALIAGVDKLRRIIIYIGGGGAIASMALGGVNLLVIMLGNVRERLREIGFRMAYGATRQEIAFMFLFEALILTAVAAMLAIFVSAIAIQYCAVYISMPMSMGMPAVALTLVYAMGAGMLFSWWPANYAARIDISDILRNE